MDTCSNALKNHGREPGCDIVTKRTMAQSKTEDTGAM